jgi:hypothetical protein
MGFLDRNLYASIARAIISVNTGITFEAVKFTSDEIRVVGSKVRKSAENRKTAAVATLKASIPI